jgi:hypothetical protein
MLWPVFSSKKISPQQPDSGKTSFLVGINCDGHDVKIALPMVPNLNYHFFPELGTNSFEVVCDDTIVSHVGAARTLAGRCLNKMFYKPHRKLSFDGFLLGVSGPQIARDQFYHFLREFRSVCSRDDLRLFSLPELTLGWTIETSPIVRKKIALPGEQKAVIVCHLYYMEVIDEIAALIGSLTQQFDVIVTMPVSREEWRARILALIPDARIFTFDNFGRDVRPFIKLLEQGLLDDYDLICKIHSKMSRSGGRQQIYGDFWRRRLLLDLLGVESVLDDTLQRFAQDRKLGMMGPAAYRCPGPLFDESVGWGPNREKVSDLAGRLGIADTEIVLDFFAGAMFWVRREALEPLRHLALADSYFEPEQGLRDGGPEHAVERIFAMAVTKAGYRLENIKAVGCGTVN